MATISRFARNTLVAVCAGVAVSVAGQALAAGKTFTVATDATWPPMEMVNAEKQIVGLDIDYLNAVAKEAGFAVSFKNTAWDGIFAGLEAGQYDIIASSVTITEERRKKYDFSAPYIDIGQILVVPKAETATALAGLKGKKVGAQIGTTGAFEIRKVEGVETKTYDEIGLAFEDMAAGRIAGVVCDEPVAVQFALQKAEYQEKFKIVGSSFTTEAYGFVVRKGNAALIELLDKGIAAVKAKKLDEQLRAKWLR
jgi:polar amino acid transport system substrate-binding protein